jgi:hypothetical protein
MGKHLMPFLFLVMMVNTWPFLPTETMEAAEIQTYLLHSGKINTKPIVRLM